MIKHLSYFQVDLRHPGHFKHKMLVSQHNLR